MPPENPLISELTTRAPVPVKVAQLHKGSEEVILTLQTKEHILASACSAKLCQGGKDHGLLL